MPRGEGGQALVEFIAILPIFLVITFAVIEFGKGLNYWIDLTHLSNEGARYAAVNRWPGCPDSGTCSPTTLTAYLESRANTQELVDGGTNVSDPMCVEIAYPESGSQDVGKAVKVTVKVEYQLAVVDGLLGFIGADELVGPINLNSSATMRLEQIPSRVPPASSC